MASQHDQLAADADVVIHDHFGDDATVVYTPKSGDPVTLTKPILTAQRTEEQPDQQGGILRRRVRELTLKTSEVAAPELSATVTIDSVAWAVSRIIAAGENFCTLELVIRDPIERSRRGYRR